MLTKIDRLVQRISIINTVVDKVVSMVAPSTPAIAACPNNWYTYSDRSVKACWAECASMYNKCVTKRMRTYRYVSAPYYCEAMLWYSCNSTSCVGPSNC